MPKSSKLYRENAHINHLTISSPPISRLMPIQYDGSDTYFSSLPSKSEITKSDRDRINAIQEELVIDNSTGE